MYGILILLTGFFFGFVCGIYGGRGLPLETDIEVTYPWTQRGYNRLVRLLVKI